jgi:hypothetical protein
VHHSLCTRPAKPDSHSVLWRHHWSAVARIQHRYNVQVHLLPVFLSYLRPHAALHIASAFLIVSRIWVIFLCVTLLVTFFVKLFLIKVEMPKQEIRLTQRLIWNGVGSVVLRTTY